MPAALTPTKDTYLSETQGQLGGGSTMVCGQPLAFAVPVITRILISFDLSAYDGVSLSAAILRLTLIQAMFPDATHTISAYELTKDWTEGETTWTYADQLADEEWATAGGDFDPTPFSAATVSDGATTLEINLLPLALQKRGGTMNVMLRLPEGAGHNNHFLTCHSKEAIVEANRPTLTLAGRGCLVVGDQTITNLTCSDRAITGLAISDVGCAA